MGFDMQKMIKQAQKMQEQLSAAQAELSGIEVEGSAGGGAVTVTCNGRGEVLKVVVSKEAVDDIESLQEMLVAAFQDAHRRANDLAQQKMSGITQGLNIPGLPF